MNKQFLDSLLTTLKAVSVGGDFKAPCPLCQSKETAVDKFSMAVSPGNTKLVILYCFKCCIPENKQHNNKWLREVASRLNLDSRFWEVLDKDTIQNIWSNTTNTIPTYIERATTDTINRVYTELLNSLELRSEHSKWLGRRGLKEDTAWELGYRSTPIRIDKGTGSYLGEYKGVFADSLTEDLLSVPGFIRDGKGIVKLLLRDYAILTPCRDTKGRICAIKQRLLDGKKQRMRLLSSALHGGPVAINRTHCPLGVGKQKWDCLWITEGERKADVSWMVGGLPTVSIPGVNAWRLVLPTLTEVATKNSKIVVALDKDNKEATKKAEHNLIVELVKEGYRDIEIAKWNGEKGLDDALIKNLNIEVESVDCSSIIIFLSQPKNNPSQDLSKATSLQNAQIIPYLKQVGPQLLSSIPAYLPEIIKLIKAGKLKKVDYTKRGPVVAAI